MTPTLHRVNFLILVLLLLLNGGHSYDANRALIHNEARIQNTQNVIVAIKDIFSALQDAETGQRGFLLTSDPTYLQPYEDAIGELRNRREQLVDLDFELDEQREDAVRFGNLIDRKMNELASVIEVLRQGRRDAALELLRTNEGNALMARIRELVGEMEAREYALMTEQRAAVERSRKQVLRSIDLATIAGLIFLSAAFYSVQKAIRTERENVAKLTLTNEELEEIVARRTAELDRYARELRRSNRELQDFAFVASHDLQEPLRKIRAFGDRLKTSYAAPLGEGVDYVNRMQAAAERMSRLISDLLTFSRVTTRARPFERTSLQAVLEEALDDLESAIEETHARIVADPLPEIEADRTQMRQLFQNLIGNSLKFVAPGTVPEIHITTSLSAREDDPEKRIWYRILFRDNGIGFEEEFSEKIFTPFQRLHARDAYAGTGIGLAVCRRVVERHGGYIGVTSQPGLGSTFEIQLPRTQVANGVAPTEGPDA